MKKILLVGTLTKKELRQSNNGQTQYYNLTVTENITTKDGKTFQSNTFVTAFSSLFNTVQSLAEGSIIMVEGAPNARAYTKQNGEQAVSIDITASSISFLEGPTNTQPTMQQTFQTNNVGNSNQFAQQVAQFNNQFNNNGGNNGFSPF